MGTSNDTGLGDERQEEVRCSPSFFADRNPRCGFAGFRYFCYSAEVSERILVEMTDRGTITLPKALRPATNLFEVRTQPDGSIELIPQHTIAASQAWFWTDRWQRMEREADADVAAGRVTAQEDIDALLRALDQEAT
jgi:hypothetical protein